MNMKKLTLNQQLEKITEEKLPKLEDLEACLTAMDIKCKIAERVDGGKYITTTCQQCEKRVKVHKKNGMWHWHCLDNDCEYLPKKHSNLIGLIREYRTELNPHKTINLLKQVLYTAVAEEYGETTVDFGEYEDHSFDQIAAVNYQYLEWMLCPVGEYETYAEENLAVLSQEDNYKLGIYLHGREKIESVLLQSA
ncbi:MAG: hypothetical protein GXP26_02860 [Planctomycetes bacterium]|nr:hypothetical protein [Planctomycetota bacterium]